MYPFSSNVGNRYTERQTDTETDRHRQKHNHPPSQAGDKYTTYYTVLSLWCYHYFIQQQNIHLTTVYQNTLEKIVGLSTSHIIS